MPISNPSQHGPYSVAEAVYRDLVDAKRKRAIQATVFYPTDAPAPSPLIMLSHGFTAHMGAYNFLGRGLAAHGYVVVAANHVGDTTHDVIGFMLDCVVKTEKGTVNWTATFQNLMKNGYKLATNSQFYKRPADISFLIDTAERWAKDDSLLAGKIDTSRIGMTGHSFGGYTTFAVAGATIDLAGMHARVAEDKAAAPGEKANPMAAFASASRDPGRFMDQMATAPEANHHGDEISFRDDRVQAAIALAPASQGYGDGLSRIAIPMMVMAGDKDPLYDPDNTGAYRLLRPPKYWVALKGAGHMAFNDTIEELIPPDLRARMAALGMGGGPGGGAPSMMLGGLADAGSYPLADAHALIVAMEAAFFNVYLKQDEGSATCLTPEFVTPFSGSRAIFESKR